MIRTVPIPSQTMVDPFIVRETFVRVRFILSALTVTLPIPGTEVPSFTVIVFPPVVICHTTRTMVPFSTGTQRKTAADPSSTVVSSGVS